MYISLFVLTLLVLLLLLAFGLLSALILIGLRVNSLTNLHGGVLKSLKSLSDLFGILSSDGLIKAGDVTLDLGLDRVRNSASMLLKLLLSVVDHGVGLILEINDLSSLLIGGLGGFSFLDHSVDVGVGETTA